MKTIYRATAMLSASSAIGVAVSVLAGKGRAVLIGPDGLGLFVLLQSVVLLAALIGRFGIGPGFVKLAAAAIDAGEDTEVAATKRAARLLRLGLGALTVILLILLRDPVSRLFLGGSEHAASLLIAVVALVFTLAFDLEVNILTAYQRTGSLARWWILNSALGAFVGLSVLFLLGSRGIPLSIVGAALVSWLLATALVRSSVPALRTSPTFAAVKHAARQLLAFGGPYTASQLVGSGVILLIPAMTLAILGRTSVGFYQAAFAVGNNYLGFLAAAMSSDYYPRVAAAGNDGQTVSGLINQQQRLVFVVAFPVILAALALCPYFMPIIYTPAFTPSVPVLEWMLLGDLFLFSSWTISYAILARCGGMVYFGIEVAGGAAHLITAWLGLIWFGLPGLGISWLASNVIYLSVVYAVARRNFGLRWTRPNLRLLGVAAVTIVLARVAISSGLEPLRLAVLAACLSGAAIFSLRTLRQEYGGDWRQRAMLRVRTQFGRGQAVS